MSNTKPSERETNKAYENFLDESKDVEGKKSPLRTVPGFEETTGRGSFDSAVAPKNVFDNPVETYDPARIKRESFIEGVTKDINEFDLALSQNELFVRKSREQLKRFKEFARNSEVDIDIMFRLRSDNKIIAGDLGRYKKKADSLQVNLETEKAKHLAANNRYAEIRAALEKAREEILDLIERDTNYREEIEQHSILAVQRETDLLQLNRTTEKLEIEYQALQDQNQRYAAELDSRINSSLENEKKLEESSNKLDSQLTSNEKLVGENKSLAHSMDNLQADNVELRSRLLSIEHESVEAEKRTNEKYRITDEELYSLRARVESLQSQLRVKSQVSKDLLEQTKTALVEAKVSKEASRDLHNRLVDATRQRDQDQEQVSSLNGEIEELNKRFEKLLGEMEQARKDNIHLTRSLKLQRQSWGAPVESSTRKFDDEAELEIRAIPPGTKTH